MKKIIAACLVAALALTLAGCGAVKDQTTAGREKFVLTDNMKIIEQQVEELNGDGKKVLAEKTL